MIPIEQMRGLSPKLLVKGHTGSQSLARSPGFWSHHLAIILHCPRKALGKHQFQSPGFQNERKKAQTRPPQLVGQRMGESQAL